MKKTEKLHTWGIIVLTASAWCWMVLLCGQFPGGNGTETEPWLIASAQDLSNVRNYSDAHFLQVEDIYLTGKFQPIEVFSGFFDGNKHSIFNLIIVSDKNDVALFGTLLNGKLIRIRLKGGSVTGGNNVGRQCPIKCV